MGKVDEIVREIKENELIGDREEYDLEDLKLSYPGLTDEEAKELYERIHGHKFLE